MIRSALLAATAAAALALAGCATGPAPAASRSTLALYPAKTATQKSLNELPPPRQPVAVAVYGFADQTGKFEKIDAGQTLSRAVTQGGGSILVKALQDAGERKWFTVVEREAFKNLLTERQLITEMRQRYLGEQGVNPQALPALLFAGVLLEGGIISYDTNSYTGGNGLAIMGAGINGKYKQDTVTVYLRAVSVKTGEILTTVTTSKTITSKAVDTNLFAYVDSDKIAEAEVGYTTNEPGQIALQQAIEKAVYGLVMEGVDLKLWNFADANAGWPMLWRYRQERDGALTAAQVEAISRARRAERAHRTSAPTKSERPAAPPPASGLARAPTPSLPQVRTAEADRPGAQPPVPSGTAAPAAPSTAMATPSGAKGDQVL